ncbi:MAG: immunity protein Imm5 [Tannerella sp.]|jgi:hypothetical protein|nr:immunity protein Imm5 [Tannerella sp.]
MENVQLLSKRLLQIIKESENGNLPLKDRVFILNILDNPDSVNKLSLECLKKVYHIWDREYPNHTAMIEIINKANSYLYHNIGDEKAFKHLYDVYYYHFLSKNGTAGAIGMSALTLCNCIACRSGLTAENCKCEENNASEWQNWNPDFHASIAYSGGNPFFMEGDVNKRKEFWIWYIDTAIQLYDNPGKPVIDFSTSNIKTTRNTFSPRIQSCETGFIKEKLGKIIDMTFEDMLYQEKHVNFSKIEINTICLELAGVFHEAFFHDTRNNKVKIKDVREWPSERQWVIMNSIKQDMYKQNPEEGAWIESQMIIHPDKTYNIHFIYDEYELLSKIARNHENLLEEFKVYPRSRQYTPEWCHSILGMQPQISGNEKQTPSYFFA